MTNPPRPHSPMDPELSPSETVAPDMHERPERPATPPLPERLVAQPEIRKPPPKVRDKVLYEIASYAISESRKHIPSSTGIRTPSPPHAEIGPVQLSAAFVLAFVVIYGAVKFARRFTLRKPK